MLSKLMQIMLLDTCNTLWAVVSPGHMLHYKGRKTTVSKCLLLWSRRCPAPWTNKLTLNMSNLFKNKLTLAHLLMLKTAALRRPCCEFALFQFSILVRLFIPTYFVKCTQRQLKLNSKASYPSSGLSEAKWNFAVACLCYP